MAAFLNYQPQTHQKCISEMLIFLWFLLAVKLERHILKDEQ
jgi:hypothetical protein